MSNFTIDAAGNITVTAAGVAALIAGAYVVNVEAVNVTGAGLGSVTVTVTPATLPLPVVKNAAFTLSLPLVAGQTVGTVTATGNPTSWAILP